MQYQGITLRGEFLRIFLIHNIVFSYYFYLFIYLFIYFLSIVNRYLNFSKLPFYIHVWRKSPKGGAVQ